jgi:hypothetical protein
VGVMARVFVVCTGFSIMCRHGLTMMIMMPVPRLSWLLNHLGMGMMMMIHGTILLEYVA